MATWPATLPDPLVNGYSEKYPADQRLRTKMDKGPAKVRRRFSAGVRPFTVKYKLTAAQATTLETFVETTLSGGTLSFDWTQPRTSASVSARIVTGPDYEGDENDHYIATLTLEVLP